MRNPAAEYVERDFLAGGLTRPAVLRGLGIPFWYIIPMVGFPLVMVAITWNVFWLFSMIVIAAFARWFAGRDHNYPRVLRLSLLSGAMFADRHTWGGYTVDPLGKFL